jgi:hypothetical protein
LPCDAYKRLEAEFKSASIQYAQFTHKENAGIRGTTKTEGARLAREARNRKSALIDQMIGHQQNCEACKAMESSPDTIKTASQ